MTFFARLFSHEAQTHYQRGMKAYNAGEYSYALPEFQLVLEMTSQDSDPLRSLATFYAAESAAHLGKKALDRQQAAVALDFFKQALRWNWRYPELHYWVALACVDLDQLAQATIHLELAQELDQDHLEVKILRMLLLQRTGRSRAAAALLGEIGPSMRGTGVSDNLARAAGRLGLDWQALLQRPLKPVIFH